MDASSYRDPVREPSSSAETADTADTEGSVGSEENPRIRVGRPKKLPKPIRNQPAIHRFLNSTEPETDKETDTDSEQEDNPSPQIKI